tara:strand:- start:1914 stop:2600 length:687 start_codon:yes stop_codon:yes gene_type:complete
MAFRSADALMATEYAGEEQAMERERAEFLREQAGAQAKAEKKAQGKSLWSSIGGTLGTLGAGALTAALAAAGTIATGGLAGPLIAAAIAGGGAFAGSKLGEAGHGAQGGGSYRKDVKMKAMPTSTGKFHSGKRSAFNTQKAMEVDALQDYQDAADELLHGQQLTGALTSAVTAGMGAGVKDLAKVGKAGTNISESFDMMDTGAGALESLDSFDAMSSPFSSAPTDYWS